METVRLVINPTDYVKYKLVYIGTNQFLSGLPQKDITIKRALKEYNINDLLQSGLYLLREIKHGE